MRLKLPFPPSSLSGHHNSHWRVVRKVSNAHRQNAKDTASEQAFAVPEEGDIPLHIHFVPPDRRGDRTNYWNRCKAYIDGIADALEVNDSRFLPSMSFAEPQSPGWVEVTVG